MVHSIIRNFKGALLASALLLLSFFLLQPSPAFAANDDYIVSGGLPLGPFVVETPVALTSVIIEEAGAGADDFIGDPEFIRIEIGSNYPSVTFDPAMVVGDLMISGTCGYNDANVLNFDLDNRGIDITIVDTIGLGGCLPAQQIIVDGLSVVGTYSTDEPGVVQPLVGVDATAVTPGVLEDSSQGVNQAVTAAEAVVLVAMDDAAVGAGNTFTINISGLPRPLTDSDRIAIEFPPHIFVNVPPGNATDISFLPPMSNLSCSTTGQVVSCSPAGGSTTNLSGSFTIDGISADYASTDDIVSFVVDNGNDGQNLAIDATVALADTDVADAATTVTSSDPTVAADQEISVDLSTPFSGGADVDDSFVITFSNQFDVTEVDPTDLITGTLLGGATLECDNPAGQDVECTVTAGTTNQSGTIVIPDIVLLYEDATDIVSVVMLQEGVVGNEAARDDVVPTDDIVAADATASVDFGTSEIDVSTTARVNFTIPSRNGAGLIGGDYITVEFPNHVDLTALDVAATQDFGGLGVVTCSAVLQVANCRTDAPIPPGDSYFELSGLVQTSTSAADVVEVAVVDDGSSANIAFDATVPTTDSQLTETSGGGSGGGSGGSITQGCSWPSDCYGTGEADDPILPAGDPENEPEQDTESTSDLEPDTTPDPSVGHTFTDVPQIWSDLLAAPLALLQDLGVLEGENRDGRTSNVTGVLKRADAAKMVAETFNLPLPTIGPDTDLVFTDFNDGNRNEWFVPYAIAMYNAGYMYGQGGEPGNPGEFDAGTPMNVAEVNQLLFNIMQPEDSIPALDLSIGKYEGVIPGIWYEEPLAWADYGPEVDGDNMTLLPLDLYDAPGLLDLPIDPGQDLLRGQLAYKLYVILLSMGMAG